jgi:hypothetical protein
MKLFKKKKKKRRVEAIPDEVLKNRRDMKNWKERFFEVKKIADEPNLVPPEVVLGKRPKLATDYFRELPEFRYGKEVNNKG